MINFIVMWVIVVALAIVIEMFTNDLTSIWFAAGGLVAIVFAAFGADMTWQLLAYTVSTVLCLFPLRRFVKNKLEKNIIKTNVDSVVGKAAIVKEVFDKYSHLGRVDIDGMSWLAFYEGDAKIDDELIVKEVSGSKVILYKGENK